MGILKKMLVKGCALLRLGAKVDTIRDTLENNEQKVGVGIVKCALSYPLKLIANNAGVNGNVVVEKVLSKRLGFSTTKP